MNRYTVLVSIFSAEKPHEWLKSVVMLNMFFCVSVDYDSDIIRAVEHFYAHIFKLHHMFDIRYLLLM